MSSLQLLKSIQSRSDLALVLGYSPAMLSYMLYKKPKSTLYATFDIPKRTGGYRTIQAPCSELKALQRKVAALLQECLEEIRASRPNKLPVIAHGFVKGQSTLTNASGHRQRRFVFNTDLENFFSTIHIGRVRGFFISNNDFKLHPQVATTLAQIVCFDDALPQGAPSSPIVSNLIGHLLDVRLAKLAKNNGCSYSRYADDLTFSTNKSLFPDQIASLADPERHIWTVGAAVEDIIKRCGFSVNHAKSRMDYSDSRQTVTGLVVNKKINVPSDFRRNARAMASSLFTKGTFEIYRVVEQPNGDKVVEKAPGTMRHLSGVFSYIYMVGHWNRVKAGLKDNVELSSIEKVHKDFLFYRDFYSSDMPTILCEGKTDNVYIKSALTRLYLNHPVLAGLGAKGEVELKVKLFKYSRMASRLLKLTGGAPVLKNFIEGYTSWCAKYKSQSASNPVIVLIDNDSGASPIYGWFGGVKKIPKPDGMQPFYYVGQNLYIVPTPKSAANQQTKIEDLFKSDALGVKLGNKVFNPDNDTDTSTEYGKHYFAEHVVKAKQKTLDFSGFDPILNVISNIILNHAGLVNAAKS